MITIANFGTLMEAELLRLKLSSFGIEAFIPDELTASVAPHIFASKSGVRVQVLHKDLEQAGKVINEEFDTLGDGEALDSSESFEPCGAE